MFGFVYEFYQDVGKGKKVVELSWFHEGKAEEGLRKERLQRPSGLMTGRTVNAKLSFDTFARQSNPKSKTKTKHRVSSSEAHTDSIFLLLHSSTPDDYTASLLAAPALLIMF